MLRFSACLFKPPSRKTLIGQLSQAFTSSSADFCKDGAAGDIAEDDDCIVVTSQPYRGPDGSFKGTVSEYGLGAFLCGLSILVFPQCSYST